MGYAIAEAARDRGADVTLVTAPSAHRPLPSACASTRADTAEQHAHRWSRGAVADPRVEPLRPTTVFVIQAGEDEEGGYGRSTLRPERRRTSTQPRAGGIVKGLSPPAEAACLLRTLAPNSRAASIRRGKRLTLPGAGFGSEENKVWLVDESGDTELPLMAKYDVAMAILDRVAALVDARHSKER